MRRAEKEEKKRAQMEKRAALRALQKKEEEEMAKRNKKVAPKKLTRRSIESAAKIRMEAEKLKREKKNALRPQPELQENMNKYLTQEWATSVDQALSALNVEVDQHPERRMKSAHKAFNEVTIPMLKQQFPTLKHSQLKEKAWKMWQNSPENPMNQTQ